MSVTEDRTISLLGDHYAFIDAKIESGDYIDASDVARAGLRALKERDEAVRQWLMHGVAPVYDAMTADPGRALSRASVAADIRSLHTKRTKAPM